MADSLPYIMVRTEGDGMENVTASPEILVEIPTQKQVTKPLNAKTIKTASLISMQPSRPPERKTSHTLPHKIIKEPKFVPYEPYKAAVRPIIPKPKESSKRKKLIEIHRQRTASLSSEPKSVDKSISHVEEDYSKLEEENKKLRMENQELENQLTLQVQVNSELKNLLVAAVGEDMETRVNCLAEDKQHLAMKLINTAKKLSTHQEQVEWLAGQCDVWRSKFLASSVMVEELARWKAALSQKINEGERVLRGMLDERKIVRKNLINIYSSLVLLRDNFDLLRPRVPLKTSNVMDLASQSVHILNGLVVQLLGGAKDVAVDAKIHDLPQLTDGEKAADYVSLL